ncbi:hypothetical protein LPJ59_003113 [Coemansia sp. RSA 2399]|nr:hypothetical protein LPJ59_003113 [Coemansia sp. RSA 2399]
MGDSVHRPTFIGFHSRDASNQILYISSGCRQSMGYTPEFMVSKQAHEFIADPFKDDYSSIYDGKKEEENTEDDEANAYVMYMNVKTASGNPVLHRLTTFKCDNCVIVIAMGFPDIPYQSKHELEVQMLDGAMKRMNVKVAFVLENPKATEVLVNEGVRRQNGPLVVFVTGSIGRLIEADTADLMRYPFMKLVAPEDLLRVSKFFEKLSEATDVIFETFSLLQRPHIINGDIVVTDEQNTRVVVECLGASVPDGMAVLLRKLRSEAPPTMDAMGNYLRPKVHEVDEESGYITLSEMISDDPETSDAGEWSRLM